MLYTQLVLRVRLVVVELVDAYRREHRVEDRELARREAADHARGGAVTELYHSTPSPRRRITGRRLATGTNCILVLTKSMGVAPPCVTCVEMKQCVASFRAP